MLTSLTDLQRRFSSEGLRELPVRGPPASSVRTVVARGRAFEHASCNRRRQQRRAPSYMRASCR
jgi:hypothetical protein